MSGERVRAAEPPSNAATEWIVGRPDRLSEMFRSKRDALVLQRLA
jgi:hypothetical protein